MNYADRPHEYIPDWPGPMVRCLVCRLDQRHPIHDLAAAASLPDPATTEASADTVARYEREIQRLHRICDEVAQIIGEHVDHWTANHALTCVLLLIRVRANQDQPPE